MTVNDFLKRLKPEDYDKVMVYRDRQGGWSNIWFTVNECGIDIIDEDNAIFSEDK